MTKFKKIMNLTAARHHWVAIGLVGLLSFGGNLLLSGYRGIPVPYIHDEFSYLLAADTFAHGRVTNPTHPMWEHFETFHVLQKPTYMSKYPPGQGFFMAVGQVLFGRPIYGVWLSASFMCMAICWMLYAWLPPYWAFLGGLVSVLQFGVFTYWSQSYWGGAVAALGGALIFGALPRIFKYQRLRDALWLGLGFAILVNSRPLEGILVGIPVGCLVLPWKIKWQDIKNLKFINRILLPVILLLMITIIGLGAYNKAVTGKAYLFPHVLNAKTQTMVPLFIWQKLRPMPVIRHQTIRKFEIFVRNKYYFQKRTRRGFWNDETNDAFRLFMFYFGYVLAIPILFFLLRFGRNRSSALRLVLAILLILCMCAAMPFRTQVHYFSPVTGLVVLMLTLGLRSFVCVKFFKRSVILGTVYILIAAQLIINILACIPPVLLVSYGFISQGPHLDSFSYFTREQLKTSLMQKGGKYLVLVSTPTNPHSRKVWYHNNGESFVRSPPFFYNDWVYNGADIDKSPIVWARSMDAKHNEQLLAYFKDRQAWYVTVNWEYATPKKYDQR